MKNRILFLFIPLVLIVITLVFFWNIKNDSIHSTPGVMATLPDFELTDSNGSTFTKKDLKNRINVVDFIFTRCQGPCPVMSGYMKSLYKKYYDTPELRFISISVDPDYDTQQVLNEYSKRYGVNDDRWVFLRGEMQKIMDLSENGFLLPAENLPSGHTIRWVLVDGDGGIRGYYDGTDVESIVKMENDALKLIGEI